MRAYVHAFIEERDPMPTKLDTRFPFRRLADHCYRTYRWAQRIQAREGDEREIVEIAALLHDVGKCVDRTPEGHARVGAKICARYLESRRFSADVTARVTHVVRFHVHSMHAVDLPLEGRIARDADLLAKVGALTVLWDAMAAGAQEPHSYTITAQRIRTACERLKGRGDRALHTETGRRFYRERLEFLSHFVSNLEYELGGQNELDQGFVPRRAG